MDLQRNEETDMKEKYVERQRDEGEKGAWFKHYFVLVYNNQNHNLLKIF